MEFFRQPSEPEPREPIESSDAQQSQEAESESSQASLDASEYEYFVKLGDEYFAQNQLERAMACYAQAGDRDGLIKVKNACLARADIINAQVAAQYLDESLSHDDFIVMANTLIHGGKFTQAYKILRQAGYQVEEVAGLNNYSIIARRKSIPQERLELALEQGEPLEELEQTYAPLPLPPLPVETLILAGKKHLEYGDWYEARRRFEDALEAARKEGNDLKVNQVLILLSQLGDKCMKTHAYFSAYLAFQSLGPEQRLEKLQALIIACVKGGQHYLANLIQKELHPIISRIERDKFLKNIRISSEENPH